MTPDPSEPEPYRNKTRAEIIAWNQSLQVESARHRRAKRYWKNYAQELEKKLDAVYNNR